MRQFKPNLVALRDESKVEELKERLKGEKLPEIAVGDAGAVECAVHPDADAVVTGGSSWVFGEAAGCSMQR